MNLQEIRIHGFVHGFAAIHWFSVSNTQVFSCLCFCLPMPMLKYGTEMSFKKKKHWVFLLMRFHPRHFCVSQCKRVSMQENKNKSSQNSLRSQKHYFDPFRYGHHHFFAFYSDTGKVAMAIPRRDSPRGTENLSVDTLTPGEPHSVMALGNIAAIETHQNKTRKATEE